MRRVGDKASEEVIDVSAIQRRMDEMSGYAVLTAQLF